MSATCDVTALTGVLEQIGSSRCAKVIRQIDRQSQSEGGSLMLDVLRQPFGETQAMREAERVVSCLESVS